MIHGGAIVLFLTFCTRHTGDRRPLATTPYQTLLMGGVLRLDKVFSALSDPTRREILISLSHGSRSVSELAEPFGLSLTAVLKHIQVLEESGLLHREKRGRVVSCTLSALPLAAAAEWLVAYERFWA